MADKNELTPMMRQYQEIKKEHPDEILFFRLGDFYEMFDEDAIEVSRLLNLTLTHRGSAPMCGIPYHAAVNYLKRLLDEGKKVAVCEQLSLPENSRELAKREVIQVYTPGTVVEDEYLDSFSDNFVLAVDLVKGEIYTALCDISSGKFYAKHLAKDSRFSTLSAFISSFSISEILINEDLYFTNKDLRNVLDMQGRIITKLPPWYFTLKEGRAQIKENLGVSGLSPFGLGEKDTLLSPIGALFHYVRDMSKSDLRQIENIQVLTDEGFLLLDEATEKNLEIVRSLQSGGSAFTLFSAVNKTRTAAGSRLLKDTLLHPLCDKDKINERLSWTEKLVDDIDERRRIRNLLSSSADLIRLSTKLEMNRSVVRDLIAIKESLFSFFRLVGERQEYLKLLKANLENPDELLSLASEIDNAINPECTNATHSGTIIKEGYDGKLDELRKIHLTGSSLLDEYLEKVKAETGITIMKCGENRIIGMYLEVPKGQLSKVPGYFTRRQTLVGGERFTTSELSAIEEKINSAESDFNTRERELYNSIVSAAVKHSRDLFAIGNMFAELDVYQSFAEVASLYNYVRPELTDGGQLEIAEGRHPVVEQYIEHNSFVKNSFSTCESRFALITGPNMAGKSTFLRQNALIVLLAHCGSFVPASSARIPLTDRIFCRVGASDNLARGESTFLVEMQEASFILRNATERSFVIMDEIGRGTSTQDGMSIAYAIMMYLLDLGCITLFATHYHELTMIDTSKMQLLTLEVSQDRNNIIFLRKAVRGVAESSYGLHVAKLAGIPSSVIRTASNFQKKHFADYKMNINESQLDLFVDTNNVSSSDKDHLIDEISDFDISNSTPLDALLLVQKLQSEIKEITRKK